MRLVTERPKEEVVTAFEMSWVTGPNEGALMWQRGVFGVLIWELLSPEERKLTIEQTVRAISGTPIEDSELVSAKKALSQKSAEARAEIAVLMRGLLRHLVTRMYFPGDAANEQDLVLQRVPAARRATLVAQGSASQLQWDIVLQGDAETVFFDY